MRLTRFDDVAAFRSRAEPFLLAHEAAHCLQLGILAALSEQPAEYPLPPYLALVEVGAHVAAVALRTPPHNLVLSLLREDAQQTAALDVIAADLAPLQSDLPGVLGPAPLSLAFAETWQRRTGRTFQPGMRERLFELTAVRGVSGVPGHLRAATAADHDLLVTWVDAFFIEAAPEPARRVSLGGRRAGLVGLLWRPDPQRRAHRPSVHAAGATRAWLRPRRHRRLEPAAAGTRPALLLPVHRPRQSHLEPHLSGHWLPAGLRCGYLPLRRRPLSRAMGGAALAPYACTP